ncbi:hypothetical protein N8I77_001930 [Diaporthe amygdali]|uniref:Glycosyltransferase 2-like domain-containing protein n=1 Tax=Phomopsis amygdali TaxID=1214568 RepID=A0AAD9STS2_PHOAM|nr:hypothetical protein N8I77_001930 [Diaporthe amygdali]
MVDPPASRARFHASSAHVTEPKPTPKASARSDSLAALQQGARHVLATQIQQPKVVKSASSTRKSDVYASNPQLRSTSTARLPTRADDSRSEFQNGPPVSTAGHETDTGGSRTGSIATPSVSSQKYRKEAMDSLKCIRSDVMVNYLYQQALWKSYVSSLDLWQGIVLKERRGKYSFCPPQLEVFENGLLDNVKEMNVCCAMTVSTPVTRTILESMQYVELDYVPMPNGLRVQVLKTMSDLPRCQIHHFAAFLEDLRILVVWDDDPEHLLQRAEDLEAKFVKMIWGDREEQTIEMEKTEDPRALADEGNEAADLGKLEAGTAEQERRPVRIVSSIIVGFTVCLAIACMGLGWRRLAMECKVDKNFLRLALLVLTPVQLFFSMFFFQAVCGNIIQMVGPTSQINSNSKYYSGMAPESRLHRRDFIPHVTIQMPVYKEGTTAVIRPTVMSLKTAISTYEMQGGTANIFVNDDGMQLLSEEEAQERRDFYDEHQIGWVARPKHDPNGERPFVRHGKFKKASNMNYAMSVSRRVEDKLHHVPRNDTWTDLEEHHAYESALAEVLEEDKGRTWAEGNIRMGDYILLIDCDTRVPKDCFLDGVSEMEYSPQVAIIQFTSGVLNVSTTFFEQGITWFTNLIYTAITYAVSTGDVCPFVGHNALMRWSAIQSAAAFEDEDGYEKYWSESHVSEDFDMALRLQCAGYSLRYAAYTGDGFKEGVSLTVGDELARWEKYAYGCNELLFHPFRYWFTRSPFTPLFRKFITTRSIPLPKKITICSYIGTYYAIGSAWLLTVTNYLLSGWGFGLYEKYYADSFSIFFSVVMVFTGLGNLSLAVLRYRLKRGTLVGNYLENVKWIPMFTIYLGGVSLHVSQAILSHFFQIEMHWDATSKEIRDVSFHEELTTVLKKFKGTLLFCLVSTLVILVGYWAVPYQWQIRDFASIFPFAMLVGCHFLLPVALNPALVMLSW